MRKLYVFAATAIAVLAFAAVAYAENTYTVGGSAAPKGKGSKSKPLPIALKFNFGVGNTDSTLRGSPIPIYAIGSEGLVTYPKLFPTCTFSQATSTTVSPACKKAKTGGGLVQAVVGAASDLSLANSLYCNIKLNLYNISGAGSQGGMAIRLDVEPRVVWPQQLGCRADVPRAESGPGPVGDAGVEWDAHHGNIGMWHLVGARQAREGGRTREARHLGRIDRTDWLV